MATIFVENHDSFSWNVIDRLPVPREALRIVDGRDRDAVRAAVADADALVIGPGPHDPLRLPALPEAVLHAAARRIPLLGICLGHQAIGVAFGARLVRVGPVHGKRAAIRFAGARLFVGFEGPLRVMRYHSLGLADVRSPLRVIAEAGGVPMAIEHESLPIAGLQFHPDSFGSERGEELIAAFFRAAGVLEGSGARGGDAAAERLEGSRSAGGRGPATGRGDRHGLALPTTAVRDPAGARVEGRTLASSRPAPLPTGGDAWAGAGPRPGSPATELRLSAVEALPAFALLGPGFADGAGWTLLAPLAAGDPAEGEAALVFAPYEARGADAERLSGPAARFASLATDVAPAPLDPVLDETGHREAVEAIRAAIAAGDVYQVNHTLRATFACPRGAALLAALLRRGVPRFAAWVRFPDGRELVSASPERFFATEGRRILAEPMKGTAAPDDEAALAGSEKDAAELAMITDLLRNDLARIAVPRSVRVVAERRFLRLPYAVQAVSEIEAALPEGAGALEVLDALHPGGSITGAPKETAMAAIARHERAPRGAYCGALGLVEGDRAEFSILIRTAARTGEGPWTYGVGGGIVWDSDPDLELAEARLKLGALR